jgi:acetolactate synthase small subunit
MVWYLRLTVNDERGIIARVAETVAREGMNIDSVQQEPHSPKERLSLFFTVEPVSEPNVRRAVEKINDFAFMVEPVLLLRMEENALAAEVT